MQCSGVPVIYAQKLGVHLPWVHVHSSICETFSTVVLHGSGQLMGRSICLRYMYILLYVKLIWCSSLAWIYGQLEEGGWGQSAMGVCAFFHM